MNDKRTETHACDSISRQALLEEYDRLHVGEPGRARKMIEDAPSAQPEQAIPISWLEKEIERLESRKNSFAVLDAMQLKALIKRWESEQK